uniref:Serpentine Receptor, class T n=1 Tax=Steinernema glaseri TaxID=37863 RepID=A0A1I8A035_9BILA
MDLFFFQREQYEHFYNCSGYTAEQWTNFGDKQTVIGVYSIMLSTVALILYIPCMKVMMEPKLWKLSCYKLMFLNGIVDHIGIVGSLISGFLSLKGVVFCSYPTFLYLTGTVVVSQYATQQVVAVLLALNRCIEFWQKPSLNALFEGNRMYMWWMIPLVHFTVMVFFTVACPFTSIVNMWMFDPYFGIPGIQTDKSLYKDVPLLNYTNLFCFVTLNGAYVFLVGSVMYRTRQGNQAFLSKLQKQVTLYYSTIVLRNTYFCSDYDTSSAHLCGAIIIYMVMNRTIRQGVIAFYLNLAGYSAATQNIYSTDISQRPRSCAVHPTI